MSTELDDDLIPEALALIEELGADAQITARTASYNRTTGITTFSGAVAHDVKISPPWPRKRGFAPGTTQTEESTKVYLAASGLAFTPAAGQPLTLMVESGGVSAAANSYQITKATPIMSGQAIAIWELELEG